MILNELWSLFERELFPVSSSDILFNQFKDADIRVDLPNAPEIRRKNLYNYLSSFEARPQILILGEAAGPWGFRFSGVPFTGEKQICEGTLGFFGNQSSNNNPLIRIKKTPPYISNSAQIFWKLMHPYISKFFIWDCVPLHPHKNDNILSVRNPGKKEISQFSDLNREIINILKPQSILSIGRCAEDALRCFNIRSVYIRHPSRGGSKIFQEHIGKLFQEKYI